MEEQRVSAVFDYRGLRLLMGIIALSLPLVVSVLADTPLTSISASYHSDARDIFVGLLFVVGSFLFAYNGHAKVESVASKLASLAAVCTALFPASCDGCPSSISGVMHYASATVLFSILAYFCFIPFRSRIRHAGGKQARRSGIYLACGSIMIACMAVIFVTNQVFSELAMINMRVEYYGETVALAAFGIAWIASGKAFKYIADDDELYRLFYRKSA